MSEHRMPWVKERVLFGLQIKDNLYDNCIGREGGEILRNFLSTSTPYGTVLFFYVISVDSNPGNDGKGRNNKKNNYVNLDSGVLQLHCCVGSIPIDVNEVSSMYFIKYKKDGESSSGSAEEYMDFGVLIGIYLFYFIILNLS